MNRRRVLVTRPQPGAARTAERLLALGFDPVVMPLTETVALPHHAPEGLPDLVVATSPQAFRHLIKPAFVALSKIPVSVTGKATATAAREAGFLEIAETGGNVSRLIASLSPVLVPEMKVLYLAGRIRRPELERHLAAKGTVLSVLEVYDTLSVSYSTDKIAALSADGVLDAVLLTSVNCVAGLAAIAAKASPREPFENARLICLSQRIAEAAKRYFLNPIHAAAFPSEDALLECLAAAVR